VSPENRARFLECRAAVFYHLADGAEIATVPREVAQALLEQMTFIMFETVRNAPAGSVAESEQALRFVEGFFLSFSGAIAQNRDRFLDVAQRERTLLACQPLIWAVLRERIDYLILWRERAVDAPEAPAE
jgi:hypothetical protein